MTAVDVDALDAARAAIRDEIAGWPIGDGYYSTTIGTDDAGEIADFLLDGYLAELIAEVRRGRALREAVKGLAADYDDGSEWGTWRHAGHEIRSRILATLAAVDGEQ